MENLQNVNSVPVQFSANLPVTNAIEAQSAQQPEMKEDGDKKLIGALAGLAAIGGAIAIGVGIKKGKINFKHFKKAGQEASENLTKKDGINKSLQVVQDVSDDAQKAVINAKNNIVDAISQNATHNNLQKKADKYKNQITKLEQALNDQQGEYITIGSEKIKRSKAQGWLGNLKGELSQTNKALKETQTVDVKKMGQELSDLAKQDPEVKATVDMQRYTRKHPELSQKTQQELYQDSLQKASKQTDFAYEKYRAGAVKQGRTPISKEKYDAFKSRKA